MPAQRTSATRTAALAMLLLASSTCTLGTGQYRIISSGTCASAGRDPITKLSECEVAAAALKLSAKTAITTDDAPRPEGCYVKQGTLFLATNSANKGQGADSERKPICGTASASGGVHWQSARNLARISKKGYHFSPTIVVIGGCNNACYSTNCPCGCALKKTWYRAGSPQSGQVVKDCDRCYQNCPCETGWQGSFCDTPDNYVSLNYSTWLKFPAEEFRTTGTVVDEATVPIIVAKEYVHAKNETNTVYSNGWSVTNKVDIDTESEYEFSVWFKNDDDGVKTFVGFRCYDTDGKQIQRNVKSTKDGRPNGGYWTNPYFYAERPTVATGQSPRGIWTKITARLLPADPTKAPQGGTKATDKDANPARLISTQGSCTVNKSTVWNYIMPPDCASATLRYGTAYGDGKGDGLTYFAKPSITKVSSDTSPGSGPGTVKNTPYSANDYNCSDLPESMNHKTGLYGCAGAVFYQKDVSLQYCQGSCTPEGSCLRSFKYPWWRACCKFDGESTGCVPKGSRATRGRYLRIDALDANGKEKVLNLAEVQAFSPNGALLKPVSATLSSTHAYVELYGASKCIDDDTETFCHTLTGDADPHLVIDYGQPTEIAAIRVTNRQHECCRERINLAAVSVTTDPDGNRRVWSRVFRGTKNQRSYFFSAGPTQPHTDCSVQQQPAEHGWNMELYDPSSGWSGKIIKQTHCPDQSTYIGDKNTGMNETICQAACEAERRCRGIYGNVNPLDSHQTCRLCLVESECLGVPKVANTTATTPKPTTTTAANTVLGKAGGEPVPANTTNAAPTTTTTTPTTTPVAPATTDGLAAKLKIGPAAGGTNRSNAEGKPGTSNVATGGSGDDGPGKAVVAAVVASVIACILLVACLVYGVHFRPARTAGSPSSKGKGNGDKAKPRKPKKARKTAPAVAHNATFTWDSMRVDADGDYLGHDNEYAEPTYDTPDGLVRPPASDATYDELPELEGGHGGVSAALVPYGTSVQISQLQVGAPAHVYQDMDDVYAGFDAFGEDSDPSVRYDGSLSSPLYSEFVPNRRHLPTYPVFYHTASQEAQSVTATEAARAADQEAQDNGVYLTGEQLMQRMKNRRESSYEIKIYGCGKFTDMPPTLYEDIGAPTGIHPSSTLPRNTASSDASAAKQLSGVPFRDKDPESSLAVRLPFDVDGMAADLLPCYEAAAKGMLATQGGLDESVIMSVQFCKHDDKDTLVAAVALEEAADTQEQQKQVDAAVDALDAKIKAGALMMAVPRKGNGGDKAKVETVLMPITTCYVPVLPDKTALEHMMALHKGSKKNAKKAMRKTLKDANRRFKLVFKIKESQAYRLFLAHVQKAAGNAGVPAFTSTALPLGKAERVTAFENMSRKAAEGILLQSASNGRVKQGVSLVRAKGAQPGAYAITMVGKDAKILHHIVVQGADGVFYVNHAPLTTTCRTLEGVVQEMSLNPHDDAYKLVVLLQPKKAAKKATKKATKATKKATLAEAPNEEEEAYGFPGGDDVDDDEDEAFGFGEPEEAGGGRTVGEMAHGAGEAGRGGVANLDDVAFLPATLLPVEDVRVHPKLDRQGAENVLRKWATQGIDYDSARAAGTFLIRGDEAATGKLALSIYIFGYIEHHVLKKAGARYRMNNRDLRTLAAASLADVVRHLSRSLDGNTVPLERIIQPATGATF